MKIEAATSVDVFEVFGGSADFKLDNESSSLTDSDCRTIEKAREFVHSRSDFEREINHYSEEKLSGEMIAERSQAKTLNVIRVDRRDLARRVGSIGISERAGELREVVLQDEVNLDPKPDDDHAATARRIAELEEAVSKLRPRVSRDEAARRAASPLLDRQAKLLAEIRVKEAERAGLEAELSKSIKAIEGVPARIAEACTNHAMYCLTANRHGDLGMVGLLERMGAQTSGHFRSPDPNEYQDRKTNLAISTAKERAGLDNRDEKVKAEQDAFGASVKAFFANAVKLDEIRKAIEARTAELEKINAELSSLIAQL